MPYVELALDLIGYLAAIARQVAFPSIDNPDLTLADDLGRLRGNTRRHGETVDGGRYERRPEADRNLVVYTDLPSKLNPDGPAVLHAELQLQGQHLADDLRTPRGLLKLVQPLVMLKLYAQHVRTS